MAFAGFHEQGNDCRFATTAIQFHKPFPLEDIQRFTKIDPKTVQTNILVFDISGANNPAPPNSMTRLSVSSRFAYVARM